MKALILFRSHYGNTKKVAEALAAAYMELVERIPTHNFRLSAYQHNQLNRAPEPLDDMWITALFLNNRGADELRLLHPDIALRYFLDATKLAPTFAPAWGNVGVARRRVGDTAGALEAYRQALTIRADDSAILGNLAALYHSLGREAEAEMALKTVKLSAAIPHVLIVRGDLELTEGHTSAAIRFYKRARHVGPTLADPWVALARAELARSKPEAARADLQRALNLDPRDPDAGELLAKLDAAYPSVSP
jgi:tetratricopeptide (TPR) repeat protein